MQLYNMKYINILYKIEVENKKNYYLVFKLKNLSDLRILNIMF